MRIADETFFDFEDHEGDGVSEVVATIIATDNAGNTTTFTHTVSLNDINDAPEIDDSQAGLDGNVDEREDVLTLGDTTENDPVGFGTSGEFFFTDDDSINDTTQTHFISVTPLSAVDDNGTTIHLSVNSKRVLPIKRRAQPTVRAVLLGILILSMPMRWPWLMPWLRAKPSRKNSQLR